ncbi:hypothetical protein SAMN02910343_00643 [Dialister histaminiformans]|uniref:Loader and inhibitor of phage G40P n=1 Tax=Allisonella histaminiformans TaxID=209880 RepID=A0A1G5VHT6_9FIRM|nr:hypothetical protein [Allisonella histaminiformans]SDA45390.1 hypothetical protein SAMN02910343_00643 [Allisonella histaminiformans]
MTANQKILMLLTSLFKGFTAEQAAVYDRFLADIPASLLEKAVRSLIYTSKFPPTVAEIRAEAECIYHSASGVQESDYSRAWGELKQAIAHYGYAREPHFKDPVLTETVKRIGWKSICCSPIDDEAILRAQFRDIYKSVAESGRMQKRNDNLLKDGKVQNLVKNMAGSKALESGKA